VRIRGIEASAGLLHDRFGMGAPGTIHLLDTGAAQRQTPTVASEASRAAKQPWRKRRWAKLILATGGLIAAGVLARVTVLRSDPTPVTVVRIATGRVEETVTNSKAGTVRSRQRAALSTEIGGRVVAVPVRAGTRVRRGDVLVKLADAEWRAQLAVQQRALEAARAEARRAGTAADQAARELSRARALTREGIAAVSALDRADSEHRTAVAAYDAAQAAIRRETSAVAAAQVALARTTLRAPFDGVVAEVRTERGEWITPAPPGIPVPPVIELIDPTALYISAALDEVDVAKVQLGLPTRITLDALPHRVFAGRVSRIAPYVLDRVEEGRTFEVEITLDDPHDATLLTVGSSADVEVVLRARDGVRRVPADALIGDRAVLVVRDGVLEERSLTIGLRNWDAVEVLNGVAPGELVVVSLDRTAVRAGARVRIEGEVRR
jgi:HlyD family secretion protein